MGGEVSYPNTHVTALVLRGRGMIDVVLSLACTNSLPMSTNKYFIYLLFFFLEGGGGGGSNPLPPCCDAKYNYSNNVRRLCTTQNTY